MRCPAEVTVNKVDASNTDEIDAGAMHSLGDHGDDIPDTVPSGVADSVQSSIVLSIEFSVSGNDTFIHICIQRADFTVIIRYYCFVQTYVVMSINLFPKRFTETVCSIILRLGRLMINHNATD